MSHALHLMANLTLIKLDSRVSRQLLGVKKNQQQLTAYIVGTTTSRIVLVNILMAQNCQLSNHIEVILTDGDVDCVSYWIIRVVVT